ncbi:MAG: NAD(P)/FAD-dependent oxidoreductase [Spirochaetia bacterium]|jgi:glutathione reductase (NADPH)|nr:NAD(P)/FAD-dependent oxidoreductase [Spirochaetia bacterium]
MEKNYDVLVIGSGTAGQSAAYKLKKGGLKVALAEKSGKPGGTCALRGCQAKKWFYEGAEAVAKSRHLSALGITTPAEADWRVLRDEKNKFTSKIPERTVDNLKKAGIDYLSGDAVFLDKHTLMIDQQKISARYTVIATGAVPSSIPVKNSNLMIDSTQFLELEKLPHQIVFIGGGFISFEFAHFAARLGRSDTRCAILEAGPRPLAPFDKEMTSLLTEASKTEGIAIHTGMQITSIEKNGKAFTVVTDGGKMFEADLVVHGAGRSPDIASLSLENAGVDYTKKGITVDNKMSTSNPDIYAIGDCADTVQLARVADAEADTAAEDIISRHNGKEGTAVMDYSAVPFLLFTYPQYAMVGSTEQALEEQGISYKKSFAKELSIPTYIRVGMKSAAYKILSDDKGNILGAHIISDNAAGLINIFSLAMANNISVEKLYKMSIMTPYPSRESDIIYMLKPLLP